MAWMTTVKWDSSRCVSKPQSTAHSLSRYCPFTRPLELSKQRGCFVRVGLQVRLRLWPTVLSVGRREMNNDPLLLLPPPRVGWGVRCPFHWNRLHLKRKARSVGPNVEFCVRFLSFLLSSRGRVGMSQNQWSLLRIWPIRSFWCWKFDGGLCVDGSKALSCSQRMSASSTSLKMLPIHAFFYVERKGGDSLTCCRRCLLCRSRGSTGLTFHPTTEVTLLRPLYPSP